jgi:hypothetical protein
LSEKKVFEEMAFGETLSVEMVASPTLCYSQVGGSMAEPRRTMTPDEINTALDRLVGDSLSLIERSLREQSKPSKATLDLARWLVLRAVEAEPEAEVADPEAVELAGVLELVRG